MTFKESVTNLALKRFSLMGNYCYIISLYFIISFKTSCWLEFFYTDVTGVAVIGNYLIIHLCSFISMWIAFHSSFTWQMFSQTLQVIIFQRVKLKFRIFLLSFLFPSWDCSKAFSPDKPAPFNSHDYLPEAPSCQLIYLLL